MRSAPLALILAVALAPLTARQTGAIQQQPDTSRLRAATPPVRASSVVEAVDSGPLKLSEQATDSLKELIAKFRRDPEGLALPENGKVMMGGGSVAVASEVSGPVAVAGGPLHVYGTINGDAVAIGSDVILHPGGRVTGNAIAALGTVSLLGGSVGGEIRQLGGALGAVPQPAAAVDTPTRSTRHALALSSSWLVILVLMGIGVLVFAGDYLDGVVDSLEGRFGRSFWAGIATQLALAPVLALLVVALAVTILGILLIPFAIVAFVLAVVGLITLGFLAIARITGESIAPSASRRYHARGAALRALVVGVTLYMGLWVLASAFAWAPMAETVLRGIAVAITWVATTAGLGAAVLSRGGTRRPGGVSPAPAAAINDVPWQTPTPITGVVAAKRRTPASTSRER
jgi:hypothetical protein